jgi:hypothetical protein
MTNEKVQNAIIQRCGLLIRSTAAARHLAYLFIYFPLNKNFVEKGCNDAFLYNRKNFTEYLA